MRLLVFGLGVGLFVSAFGGAGCDRAAANDVVDCRDATWWSGRSAEWPVDTFWIGDARVSLTDAMDRLELPAQSGREALQTALIVAELELASDRGPSAADRLLPHVYAGHAWLAEAQGDAASRAGRVDGRSDGSDRDARQLADALAQQMCGS